MAATNPSPHAAKSMTTLHAALKTSGECSKTSACTIFKMDIGAKCFKYFGIGTPIQSPGLEATVSTKVSALISPLDYHGVFISFSHIMGFEIGWPKFRGGRKRGARPITQGDRVSQSGLRLSEGGRASQGVRLSEGGRASQKNEVIRMPNFRHHILRLVAA